MPRERIEDLGRLMVMINNLTDHTLFNNDGNKTPRRPKDCVEWFFQKTEDEQHDILTDWAYGMEGISHALYEMLSIAEGTDRLNEKED